MSSTVWTAPGTRLQEANILRFLKDTGAQFGWWMSACSRNSYSTASSTDAGSLMATWQGPRRRSRSTSLMAGPWKS